MDLEIFQVGGAPEYILLQPADEHDLAVLDNELKLMEEFSGKSFVLVALKIKDWDTELTPWGAPPVFGKIPFGAGAAVTLKYIKEELVPDLQQKYGELPLILGGYSLAGLFSLWSSCETAGFYGIAAASPSVWYPDFDKYLATHQLQSEYIYLSLGDKESKAKNKLMATVAEKIEAVYAKCQQDLGSSKTVLEWNQGSHFIDPDMRIAKAFAWVMKQ